MYGQSCRVVGRGGMRPLRFWGGVPLLGAQRDLPQPLVRGDPLGPLGPLGKAIHCPTKALVKKVPTRTGPCCSPSTINRHSQGLAPHQGLHFPTKQ